MIAVRAVAWTLTAYSPTAASGGVQRREWKRFSFRDIMGVSLARKAGLLVALISGEDSPLVDRFANKLGITDVAKGCKDKAEAVRELARRHGIALSEICFMGDDVNDLPRWRSSAWRRLPRGVTGGAASGSVHRDARRRQRCRPGTARRRARVAAARRARRGVAPRGKALRFGRAFHCRTGREARLSRSRRGAMHLNESLGAAKT